MAELVNTTGSSSHALIGRRVRLTNADSPIFDVVTITENSTIGARTAYALAVTASGANRNLSFLAAAEEDGGFQFVYNAGSTYNVVLKDSAASTIITLAPGELVAVVYDATAWAVLWKVTASSVPTISPIRIAFPDAATSPTTEGQLLYNADHLELHDGTGARSILMSDDIGVVVQAYSAVLTALATYGLDRQVSATIAVADSATNDAALTLQLNRLDGSTAIAAARQVMINTSTTQYAPAGQPEASVTFGTATVGSIIASGQGWCLAETDATGAFACTATNTDNEAIYFFVQAAARLSDVSKGCGVVASNTDLATWS